MPTVPTLPLGGSVVSVRVMAKANGLMKIVVMLAAEIEAQTPSTPSLTLAFDSRLCSAV